MGSCPACKAEWQGTDLVDCPVCGFELGDADQPGEWMVLGGIRDKLSADFARETLAAYDIPAVIISRSGFFGNIGLTLTSIYSGDAGLFEVSVPAGHADEASEILTMSLGTQWQRKEP